MKQDPVWTNNEIINAMADARAEERERCAQVECVRMIEETIRKAAPGLTQLICNAIAISIAIKLRAAIHALKENHHG